MKLDEEIMTINKKKKEMTRKRKGGKEESKFVVFGH